MPKREIVNLFRLQNISKTTVYRTIADCEQGTRCLGLPKSGCPKLLIENHANRICESAKNRVGESFREDFMSHETIRKVLQKGGVKGVNEYRSQFFVILLAEIIFP